MTHGLLFAIAAIGTLGVLAYFAGKRLGRTVVSGRPGLFAEALCLTLLFAWTLAHRLLWANALPIPEVVCWSNVMPILLGFTAGLASESPGMRRAPQILAVTALILIAAGQLLTPVIRPILWPVPMTESEGWRQGVCLQSHESTCAAAAAATLLNELNIVVAEREMIGRCLTSRHGTTPLGLYRGLATVAVDHHHAASVAASDPGQWAQLGQFPNVALVRFDHVRENVSNLLGPRGEGHAVVVFGRDQGSWLIGDPAVGRLRWSDEEFRSRFTGDAIFVR